MRSSSPGTAHLMCCQEVDQLSCTHNVLVLLAQVQQPQPGERGLLTPCAHTAQQAMAPLPLSTGCSQHPLAVFQQQRSAVCGDIGLAQQQPQTVRPHVPDAAGGLVKSDLQDARQK